MARGGFRQGAGRKKGSPAKLDAEARKKAFEGGLTPLDYMLSVLRDQSNSMADRMDAAKAAAPYVHAKLANVEHTGKDGGAIAISIDRPPRETREEWMARRAREVMNGMGASAGTAD